jgi:hypothetical protein
VLLDCLTELVILSIHIVYRLNLIKWPVCNSMCGCIGWYLLNTIIKFLNGRQEIYNVRCTLFQKMAILGSVSIHLLITSRNNW